MLFSLSATKLSQTSSDLYTSLHLFSPTSDTGAHLHLCGLLSDSHKGFKPQPPGPGLPAVRPRPDLSNLHSSCRVPTAQSCKQLLYQAAPSPSNGPRRPALRAERKECFQTSQGKGAEETDKGIGDPTDEQTVAQVMCRYSVASKQLQPFFKCTVQ